jgi:uncharacterized protein YjeT (DUF2065 family)
MTKVLLMAIGLVFVLEGLMPFLAPHIWRQIMQQMLMQSDKTLRTFGFVSMLIGLGFVYFFRY